MNIRAAVLSVLSIASVALVCSTASADDDDRRAGTRGHVTAWEPGRTAVIDVDPCPLQRRGTFDYPACGSKFRAKISEQLCRSRGKGKHAWFYQVGDSKVLTRNVARCE